MNRVRRWQVLLYPLGVVTAVLIAGFTLWLIYAVGSVWVGRLR